MAIPQLLIEALPATLAELGEYASVAKDLMGFYNAYKNPLDFINTALRMYPGTPRAWLGAAFRVARTFANQSTYLSYLGDQDVIPRQMMPAYQIEMSAYDPSRQYMYNVQHEIWSATQQRVLTLNVWVPSRNLLTPEGAWFQSFPTLQRLLTKYQIKVEPEDMGGDVYLSAHVVKAYRLTTGG